jgi:hypothetical protein
MVMADLQAVARYIEPYIMPIIEPFKQVFDTFASYLNDAVTALKGFYDWLMTIPGVKSLVKATTDVVTNPYESIKNSTKAAMDALAAGAELGTNWERNQTAKYMMSSAKTTGELPFMPAPEHRADYAQRAISQASGLEQQRMSAAYREAQAGTSAGGREITAEEFMRIFGIALDNSKIAKSTEETAKGVQDTKKTTITSRRGC